MNKNTRDPRLEKGAGSMTKPLAGLCFCLWMMAPSGMAQAQQGSDSGGVQFGFATAHQDPTNIIKYAEERAAQSSALFAFSPRQPLRDSFEAFNERMERAANLKFGLTFHTLYQDASKVLPGTDDSGIASVLSFTGRWGLVNRGQPTQGELFFNPEGRWDYGTTGPGTIGLASIGTAGGTANTYAAYDPTFLLRNVYYRQGSKEAGWVIRIGKITSGQMFLTSRHISPKSTYLPIAGTGLFSVAFPDSGLGFAGVRYLGDRAYIAGGIMDANGDRYNWGDVSAGDFFKAVELGVKITPRTEKAGFSKLLLWHTDGTKDGQPINAMTGNSGWGFSMLAEQELTDDGRLVLLGRYGRSFDKAATYDQQAGVHLLSYDPFDLFGHDVIGTAFNWIDSSAAGTRDEYNWETFYRFPLLPDLDLSLSYQAIFNPAFETSFDFSSVFSVRLATVF
jgi:porin